MASQVPRYTADDVDKIVNAVAIQPDPADDRDCYHGSPASQALADNLFTTIFWADPTCGRGELDRFPLEVNIQIMLDLDIKTYLALRQTNRAMRALLTGLSEYRFLTTTAFDVFDAVFEAGMASRVTLQQLHRLLCEHECMICNSQDSSDGLRVFDSRAPKSKPKIAKGVNAVDVYRTSLLSMLDAQDSKKRKRGGGHGSSAAGAKACKLDPVLAGLVKGGTTTSSGSSTVSIARADQSCAGRFLFLPTLTRCCRPCLEESPRLTVAPVSRLAMAADMPPSQFSSALCKPIFTGEARSIMVSSRDGLGTVPQAAATRILLKAGFPPSRAKEVLMMSGYLGEFVWLEDLSFRKRFVVPMPFLGPKNREVSAGYTCKGCRVAMDRLYKNLKVTLEYATPLYSTKRAFIDHFKHCPEAMKVWEGMP